MQKEYRLSFGAVLIGMALCDCDFIYGLDDGMLLGMDEEAVKQNANVWLNELENAGCTELSFDGDPVLNEDFAALLHRLASAENAIRYEKKEGREKTTLTILPECGSVWTDGETVTLCGTVPSQDELREFLSLPAGKNKLREALADAALVAHGEKEKLLSSGVDEITAEFLMQDHAHRRTRLKVTAFSGEDRKETGYVYGAEGLAKTALTYTETQELIHVVPADAAEILKIGRK